MKGGDVSESQRPLGVVQSVSRALAVRRGMELAADYVPHLTKEDCLKVAEAAARGRYADRNRLLVYVLFDTCMRVSEVINLRRDHLKETQYGWMVEIPQGKGHKAGVAAISRNVMNYIHDYCFRYRVTVRDRIFPFTRQRAHQIVGAAMKEAGIRKPEHVGSVHVWRHSGALERLRLTGNPKAVQDQLRHSSARMTLRYLKTLGAQESLRINQQVDPW